MGTRRYGIYLRVFTSISNEWAQWTSEISNVNTRRWIPYLQASMYYFVYYITILITMFLMTFRRFPTTFQRFPRIFQNFSDGLTNVYEHFPNIFQGLSKVAEDFRGGTDDVLIIPHHLWVLFKRLCSYSNDNLKTCDNNLIFWHVKISYFYMWKDMDFLSGTNPNKTLVFTCI